MRFVNDPDMPLPLKMALRDSNNKYKDDLSSFLDEKLNGEHSGTNHISVTTLIRSPRQVQLIQRHSKDITYKELDFWFTMKGSIIHYILEHYSPKSWMLETRLEVYRVINGKKVMIHGQLDALDQDDPKENVLWDWKFISGAYIADKPEHKLQLNALAHIAKEKGYNNIKSLRNCYLIERLDPKKASDPLYPTKEYLIKEHELMPSKDIESWITTRAGIHLNEKDTPDKDLPFCTDEERWIRSTTFSIYKRKKGTKKEPVQDFSSRALAHSDSMGDAHEWLSVNPQTEEIKIVEQKGYPRACDYCKASPFCNQRQRELMAM